MIAVDTNVLVYAHRKDSPWHDRAERVVRDLAEGRPAWAIAWPCVSEFLSIVTHPKIYRPPTPTARALAQVALWMESPSLALIGESVGYWPALSALITASRARGPQLHDARIAAICLEHGVSELWTADRDFGRFPGLKTRNPLVA